MKKHYTLDYTGVDAAAARIRYLLRDYNEITRRDYIRQLVSKAYRAGYITDLDRGKLAAKYNLV